MAFFTRATERHDAVSAVAPEFLDPLRQHLGAGGTLLLWLQATGTSDVSVSYVTSVPQLELLRRLWKPQERLRIQKDPVVLWDGVVGFETLQPYWDKPDLRSLWVDGVHGWGEPIDSPWEWTMEHNGLPIRIVEEDLERIDGEAYVPAADGRLLVGSYPA